MKSADNRKSEHPSRRLRSLISLPPASPLQRLANRVGILPAYIDTSGVKHLASDRTRVALLAAMGIDASSDAAIRRAQHELDRYEREHLLAPVRVVSTDSSDTSSVKVRLPPQWSGGTHWAVELMEENGDTHRAIGRAHRRLSGEICISAPVPRGIGYHTLRVLIRSNGEERHAEQLLIVTPPRCPSPGEILGRERAFGITVNLYSLKSAGNWGAGDTGDLRELIHWAGEIGAEFVGLNPLHALRNSGAEISPYRPVSRLFRNVLYLDVSDVPELVESAEARELMDSPRVRESLAQLRAGRRLEYPRVMALKRGVLELLHRKFVALHRDTRTKRERAYLRYLEEQGNELRDFATFQALSEFVEAGEAEGEGEGEGEGRSWREWHVPFRNPRSREVTAFRETHREEIDFHCYLQFELDRQLEVAAADARAAGLTIGVYQDLALGSSPDGSDAWAFPELFVRGASIGAPPDPLGPEGQNWALPPVSPRVLQSDGYRYWTALVRASLRHAGALRIDHVMGLFRQFWIPEGASDADGAYVRYPAQDLMGIVALESARVGAVVIGEDLGTVPPEVPRATGRVGMLGSRVLYFERDKRGSFRRASRYTPESLATANTHDLPTLAGFWHGRDIDLRREVGSIRSDLELEEARRTRERDKLALVRRLDAEGLLPNGKPPSTDAELVRAVHTFLCHTSAALVGFSLDDIMGETEPVNLPGVAPSLFPSWTRRMALPVETLRSDPGVAATLPPLLSRMFRH